MAQSRGPITWTNHNKIIIIRNCFSQRIIWLRKREGVVYGLSSVNANCWGDVESPRWGELGVVISWNYSPWAAPTNMERFIVAKRTLRLPDKPQPHVAESWVNWNPEGCSLDILRDVDSNIGGKSVFILTFEYQISWVHPKSFHRSHPTAQINTKPE